MRNNPRNDWGISDIERVCKQIGANCMSPTRGSHYKISSEHLDGVLPIPFRRPIKPHYIKEFVRFAEAHIRFAQKDNNND